MEEISVELRDILKEDGLYHPLNIVECFEVKLNSKLYPVLITASISRSSKAIRNMRSEDK